ncbi:hypothetical protein K7X08_035567 [Anisodus acutangulus]|uniref:Uncharacterized protein n=1 Tax=Anisodus acutangulus TaxID=402998 RepID=A0A9Q1R2H3_9SOLA|nr:hypothetical protein K7X08_035567 [Anisodus acutangulus]
MMRYIFSTETGAPPVAYGTSHVALVHRAQLRPKQVLLVPGAVGGVGLTEVQIGKVCGATVIAVARKLKGVDVLYDPVGEKLTKDSLKLLNWGGQILVIGFASGEVPVIPANIALVKVLPLSTLISFLFILLVLSFYHMIHQPNVLGDSLKELLSWLSKGLITINISHTFSLAEAHLAFTALKDRRAIGKVMLTFNDGRIVKSKL